MFEQIRPRLTYANVVSSIAVFLALAGGTVIAATQLPKNSVGAKQLKKKAVTAARIKKNAVTTAKIKKDAVTAAKIKAGAVDGGKIADGSVTGADINPGTVPYGQVVHRSRSLASVGLSDAGPLTAIPMGNPTYTQEAGRNDTYVGALDVSFDPSCGAPRTLVGVIFVDNPNPAVLAIENLVSLGQTEVSTATTRLDMAPYAANGGRFMPATAVPHTISVSAAITCTGAGGSATVTFAGVDVIGVK